MENITQEFEVKEVNQDGEVILEEIEGKGFNAKAVHKVVKGFKVGSKSVEVRVEMSGATSSNVKFSTVALVYPKNSTSPIGNTIMGHRGNVNAGSIIGLSRGVKAGDRLAMTTYYKAGVSDFTVKASNFYV